MAYTINRTNGTIVTVVGDGTTDTTTDITLIGKNYPGYGEIINENFVKMLEHFANSSQPGSPQPGQLWWDTTNKLLKVYTGTAFKIITGSTSSTSAPGSVVAGDLWWDVTNEQLKAYNGSGWTVIGPAFTSEAGTSGAVVETWTDSLAASHTVVVLYTSDVAVAVISKDATFTPSPSKTGFTSVKPGITLASTGVVANNAMTGLATNADLLDSLDSTDFMRATANTSTTGTVAISNNTGLTVGTANDAKLYVSSSDVYLENQTSGGQLLLRVRDAVGVQTNAISIAGAGTTTFVKDMTVSSSNLIVSGTTAATTSTTGALRVAGGVGVAGNLYVGANLSVTGNLAVAGSFTLTGTQTFNGSVTLGDASVDSITFNGRVASSILPTTDNTYDLGSGALKWGTVYCTTMNGIAVQARYADLAERYAADRSYPAGTVVTIGGDAEVTAATLNDDVFGVVSTNPALLMNDAAGNNDTHPPVALVGRVPVRVIGQVSKGDKLIVGPIGVAIRWTQDPDADENHPQDPPTQDQLIGRALADKYDDEEGLVEVALAAH